LVETSSSKVATMADPATNPKTSLVEFCQRYCGKSMDKNDILYTVTQHDTQYQATVQLNCINGEMFAGDLCASTKEAEQSAAQQALIGCEAEVDALAGGKRKAPAGASGGGKHLKGADGEAVDAEGSPDIQVKAKLREACKQILKRDIADGDMVYDVTAVEGGHRAVLTLPSLPGALGSHVWSGGESPFKRDAMLAAATMALESLLVDPTYGPTIDLSRVPNNEGKNHKKRQGAAGGLVGKGAMMMKGKGKGCWWGGWDEWMWMMAMKGGKGMGGKAKGKGKKQSNRSPSGPNLPREPIGDTAFVGDVLEWKGKFGWIQPQVPIDHPAASKNGGKIYVHMGDLQGIESLTVGATVQFQAYSDASGLGAAEVVLL